MTKRNIKRKGTEAERADGIKNEILGVHVISDEDNARHFGSSATVGAVLLKPTN